MTSDDQQFLDLLASIPQDVAGYGSRIADYIERHSNSLASDIREAIDSATWLPESLKPPRHASHHFFAEPPPPPKNVYEKTLDFISTHRTIIAAVLAFTGTTAYLVHASRRAHARKRRAKKLPNGAKKEIVVLACSTFHDPLTRSLAIDLERRGYMVFVTVSSTEEDSLVQQEAKADLRPLWIDLTSTVPSPAYDTHPDLEPIRELLSQSSRPVSPASPRGSTGSRHHPMTLAGIVLFPGCSEYPTGPFALLHPSDVVDSVNTRLLQPLLTVQQFLPLLARHSHDPRAPTTVVVAYPSIPQSLSPPAELPSTLISSSLSAMAASMRRELAVSGANIVVSELKLGNFDLGSTYSRVMNRDVYPDPAHVSQSQALTHWHSSQRAAAQRSRLGQSAFVKGASTREFHNAVFDALAPPQSFKAFGKYDWQLPKRSSIAFVGTGARMYDICGKFMPAALVNLMMGYHARRDKSLIPGTEKRKLHGSGLEHMDTIGKVDTIDAATGKPFDKSSQLEQGLNEYEQSDGNVWTSHDSQDFVAGSTTWEKL